MKFVHFLQNLKKIAMPSLVASLLFISPRAEAQIITPFSTGLPDPNTGSASITSIASNPDRNIWFSYEFSHNTRSGIARITPRGAVTVVAEMAGTPIDGYGNRTDEGFGHVTSGPDGNIWFTGFNLIGRLTPAGIITEFREGLPANFSRYNKIILGPDGNLWFQTASLGIGRINPSGSITIFPVPTDWRGGITDLTAGPDGNVWFTSNAGIIGRITPSGNYSLFTHGITPESGLNGITTGPDGNLWFTVNSGRIGRITPSGEVTEFSTGIPPDSSPYDIAAGGDGNLWFTEWGSSRIGRITPRGEVTEPFLSVHFITRPGQIVAASNGNLWFHASNLYRISFDQNIFMDPTLNNFSGPLPPIYTRPDKFPGTDPNPPDPAKPALSPSPVQTVDDSKYQPISPKTPVAPVLAPVAPPKPEPQKTTTPSKQSYWDKIINYLK